ncbi:hypothetical protein K439DRAFT_62845 [Ramaria rubella]|nr:hypothetical protein K439DRAFT_62845 [Ramaria rubella]
MSPMLPVSPIMIGIPPTVPIVHGHRAINMAQNRINRSHSIGRTRRIVKTGLGNKDIRQKRHSRKLPSDVMDQNLQTVIYSNLFVRVLHIVPWQTGRLPYILRILDSVSVLRSIFSVSDYSGTDIIFSVLKSLSGSSKCAISDHHDHPGDGGTCGRLPCATTTPQIQGRSRNNFQICNKRNGSPRDLGDCSMSVSPMSFTGHSCQSCQWKSNYSGRKMRRVMKLLFSNGLEVCIT